MAFGALSTLSPVLTPGVVSRVSPALLSPLLGAVAGLVAAVAMTIPMSKQSEGFTPAFVAAAALRRGRPSEVRFRDAVLVHHAAGVVVGAAYGTAFALLGLLFPRLVAVADGVALVPHVASVVVVVVFVYVFFAHVVLPSAGGVVYEEQATAVRGQWLRSTLVFGVALAVVGPLLLTVGG